MSDPPKVQEETDVTSALLRLAETIAGHTHLDTLLPLIVELTSTVLGCQGCLLYLWDDNRACFIPVAAHGLPSRLERLFQRLPIAPGDVPFVDKVVRLRRPVIVGTDDPLLPPTLRRRLSAGTILGVPLLHRERLIGVMVVTDDQEGFGSREIALINGVTRQTALAVASAHAFEAERRRRRDLETLQETIAALTAELELKALYQCIVERAAVTFAAPTAALFIHDSTSASLSPAATCGLSADYARNQRIPTDLISDLSQAHPDMRPFALPDLRFSPLGDPDLIKAEGLRAALVIPLKRGARLLGLINVYARAEVPTFDDDALALARALGQQTVIALENARLYQQAQDRSRQLAEVLAAGHEVRINQDTAAILQRIAEGIQRGLGWQVVLITRYDHAAGLVHGVASAGIPPNTLECLYSPSPLEHLRRLYERERYRISRSYFVPAEKGGSLIAREPTPWTAFKDVYANGRRGALAKPAEGWQPADFLIVPVQDRHGEVLGSIAVDAPHHGRRPALADVQALEIFADQAAVALENARLFQSEQARRRQLEGLQTTIAALSAELHLDPLLQLIAEQTAAISDATAAAVLMWDGAREKLVVRAHYGLPDEYAHCLRLPYKQILRELDRSPDSDLFTIPDLAAPAPRVADVSTPRPEPRPEPVEGPAEGELINMLGAAPGLKAALLCALQMGGQLIGALVIYSDRPRRFNADEKTLARTLAQQAAIAIENAQLYTALQTERERLRALSARLTQAQEMERTRLARELHDEAGQSLTAVRLQLAFVASILPPAVPPAVREQIDEAQALISRTLEEIRRISIDLRPSLLDDLGLMPALRWQCDHFSRHANLKVNFESTGDVRRLDADIETTVYRAAQEALTNIARHAQATEAHVALDYQSQCLCLSIADNGRGFSETADKGMGVGLMGMQERIATVGGTLRIHSQPGTGSILSIEVPLAA